MFISFCGLDGCGKTTKVDMGDKLVGKHEHCYVEKEFKGNQRADKK